MPLDIPPTEEMYIVGEETPIPNYMCVENRRSYQEIRINESAESTV